MTIPCGPVDPVPVSPTHRRMWQTLWRRCSCGLPAPCVDRRPAQSHPEPLPSTSTTQPPTAAPPTAATPLPIPTSQVPAPAGLATTIRPAAPPSSTTPPPAAAARHRGLAPTTHPTGARHPTGPARRGRTAGHPIFDSRGATRANVGRPPTAPWQKAELRARTLEPLAGRAGHLTPAQLIRTSPALHGTSRAIHERHHNSGAGS